MKINNFFFFMIYNACAHLGKLFSAILLSFLNWELFKAIHAKKKTIIFHQKYLTPLIMVNWQFLTFNYFMSPKIFAPSTSYNKQLLHDYFTIGFWGENTLFVWKWFRVHFVILFCSTRECWYRCIATNVLWA
jgi:hypothetical protein